MRALWLADVLRAEGLDVYEVPGWEDRGREMNSIDGLVWHHTASSPRTSDTAMAALLRDGRRDLAGPLSQTGLERDGTWIVVASGSANHNGYGEWGNDSLGVEAYNNGIGEPWPDVQLDAYDRGSAAILRRLNYGTDRMKAHRETDPRRKPDPTGIDMNAARARVASLIDRPPSPSPKGWLMALTDEQQDEMYLWLKNLDARLGQPGKGVSQVIADIDKRTEDLAAGKRPTILREVHDAVTDGS